VQTVDFLDTGTRLIFRPFIGDDGYIRMEIHPEDSSGGLTSSNLPFKITTEVTSNIMIKDGRTIVIGGLFRESSDSSRSQIPGLGNIPFAGALFRQQRDRTTREEIIILLTPHIVKDDSAYADASEEMLKTTEQLRVGVRKGMMWFGRERLAESCYECAAAEMAKSEPDKGKALWHLDCAINLNPKYLEAIQLKQQLTGEELTESDNSAIRGFVRRQILADRARVTPATMPTSEADADSAVSSTGTPATLPTTQPAAVASSDDADDEFSLVLKTPSTQPTTAPSTADATAADPMFSGMMKEMFTLSEDKKGATTAPTSQPSSNGDPKTTVTELPMDEVTVQPPPQMPSSEDEHNK
jgi:type IV pilus assembly protein PilQ